MKKIALLMVALLMASAFGRVGPVSEYGQLQAGRVDNGPGRIYGSCKGVTSGNEVVVQGMSLFWSIDEGDGGASFWTSDIVSGLVQRQNIQLIRAPMGVDENWGSGNYFSNTSHYQGMMNTVVRAAIDNDIYVIIDYHSHKANESADSAKQFFGYMAKEWGKYDNVIFEIFNEPISQSWETIKQYAEAVIDTIRKHSDNLIVVGNRSYDQYPNEAASNPINDKNVAYTFHFYAGIDAAGQHNTDREGANAVSAMNSGLSVFVTEWGNSGPGGNGSMYNDRSRDWYQWMKDNKLSGANWAVAKKNETASYFTTAGAWNYSTSGKWVNDSIFAFLPKSYTACSTSPTSSSSIASSSSSLPAGYTDYIDDLEDGDGFAYTGGEWYAYTDKGDKGASTISNGPGRNDGYNVVISGSTAGNSSKYVAGMTGVKLSQGANPYDPYVALGVALNEAQTAYDLSACNEISYKYKGAAHNFKAEDTSVTDYGYHQITKAASSSWTTVTVPWNMLSQEAWAKPVALSKKRIAKFTWEIKGTQPAYNYLYIDDVRCSGLAFKPVPSPASSSSSVKSSSSVASSSSMVSSSSQSSSSSKVQTVFQLTSGNADQTVTAGNAIKSIVYSIKNVTKVSVSGLPAGLMGAINKSNTTFMISGTVADSLTDNEYAYTIAVTGVDSNTTATGKITVKHKPVTTVFKLISGNPTQTVTAGDEISPIVYRYEKITSIRANIISGLDAVKNDSAKTYTISGRIPENTAQGEYGIQLGVLGPDTNFTVSSVINVKRKLVVTTIELVSGNAEQTVTAGNAIEPIVYRYENMRQITLSGIPAGLNGTKDDNAKTYTISGIVADSLTDYVYDYTIAVTGIDNNTSATGKITVRHSSSSVASSSSVLESSSSEESSSSMPESSSSSVVPASSSDILSSSSMEESSSSEIIIVESSSSQVIIVESSSGESSSSSEVVIVESSSSALPESSSSEPPSSSSESTQVVVSGSLEQTVARGEAFETITFSNVQTFDRKSWNLWFMNFKQTGDVVTVEGAVHESFPTGTSVETVMVNGQKFEITFVVTMPESSSSSAIPASSSDVESSSSEALVSSSSGTLPETSSSVAQPGTSSSEKTTFAMSPAVSRLSLVVAGRTLHVSGASDIAVEIFDMKGTPIATFGHVSGAVSLDMLRQGSFVVRLRSGSDTLIRRIAVK